jgi:ribosomal protein S7
MADKHDTLNDNFYGHVISILPYNTFTIKKLVSKMMINVKRDMSNELLSEFKLVIQTQVEQQQLVPLQILPPSLLLLQLEQTKKKRDSDGNQASKQ